MRSLHAYIKKTTNVHLVTDDSKVLETTPKKDISWIDSIYLLPDGTTTYSPKGYTKSHNTCKPRSHQAFSREHILPTDSMGKATGNN